MTGRIPIDAWQHHVMRDVVLREVHARPFESVRLPATVDHLVFVVGPRERQQAHAHLGRIAGGSGVGLPAQPGKFESFDFHGIRIRWEQHTEFISYTFVDARVADASVRDAPAGTKIWDELDPDWLKSIPGELLSATRVELIAGDRQSTRSRADQMFDNSRLVASSVADGQINLFGDFLPRDDGLVHYVMGADPSVPSRRIGRHLQRVLEIETYRLMALMGLPNAQQATASLEEAENQLAVLSQRLAHLTRDQETAVLNEITDLATRVEAIYASSYTRFSASSAYSQLVNTRVAELGETPVGNLQTFAQFLDRRLKPAMQTCIWTNRRLDDLSRRIGNLSDLLDTRVSLEQAQDQNTLLNTINQRQGAQLLLQSTVEGLSVAAITYYGSGIVSHLAKAAVDMGWPFSVQVTVAVAIPVIAVSTWVGLRRLHRRVNRVFAEH